MEKLQQATLGGGCFWGVEDLFLKLDGVHSATSGYMGGHTETVTYREICTGTTGHAEVVQIEFNPEIITYSEILHYFWEIHNPTTLNQQGPDHGTQYRSVIFYHSPDQKQQAEESKNWAQQFFTSPIVTEISAAQVFHPAEDYHQKYFQKNGGHGCHIRRPLPKP